MAGWIASWLASRHKCQSCETLREQLREARLREQRMARQQEEKDRQIAMVLESKFDKPYVAAPVDDPEPKFKFPISALSDVNDVDDASFLEAVEDAKGQANG